MRLDFDNLLVTGLQFSQHVPICQTVSYAYKTAQELADVFDGKAPGYIYTRITNPTTTALESKSLCLVFAKCQDVSDALVSHRQCRRLGSNFSSLRADAGRFVDSFC